MAALQEILATFKMPLSPSTGNGLAATAASQAMALESRNAWQRLIDEKLIEWGRHPEQFEDDGYEAPSTANLVRATELITYLRDKGVLPPLRMAPDGEGGVVFEWYDGPLHRYVEIHADGGMEYLMFQAGNLLTRHPIGRAGGGAK